MIRTLILAATLSIAPAALAQDHANHDNHAAHDDAGHAGHDHASHEDHAQTGAEAETATTATLVSTPEITAALEAGGEPVVVNVLGAVCDFCAKAMNRTFGRRDEVAATYVDLDTKTLNIVLTVPGALTDDEIDKLVIRSGYRAKAIHRGGAVNLGGDDATAPA